MARPPGKELRSLTLLSGGEKTMTAVALLFGDVPEQAEPVLRILDEVDAALDDANVGRYINVILEEFAEMTQFVVITHRKQTMTAANVLYGVTMEQAGVSKRMSVRFEEVGENGEIKKASAGSRSGRRPVVLSVFVWPVHPWLNPNFSHNGRTSSWGVAPD